MEETAATTLSPLAGAFLAAERLAKPAGMSGLHAPMNGAKVSTDDLAVKILACGFAQLAALNAVSMSIQEKKVLFVKSHNLVLKREAGSAPAGPLSDLLKCCTDGTTVKTAVYAWFGEDVTSPYLCVVNTVAQEAEKAGVVTHVQGSGAKAFLGKMLTGTTPLTVVEERRAEAEAAASAAVELWSAFEQRDPALAAALLKEVRDGIGLRTDTSDDGPSFDTFDS